jgi:hypothetical protein
MAQRASFGKLQRDRDKKAKAAAKRERRQERSAERAEDAPPVAISQEGEVSAADLLVLVERLHKGFEDGTIDYEDFEQQKADLLARLPID